MAVSNSRKIALAFAFCFLILCLKFALFLSPDSSSSSLSSTSYSFLTGSSSKKLRRSFSDAICKNRYTGGSVVIQVDISHRCAGKGEKNSHLSLSCFVQELENVVLFLKFSKDSGRIAENKVDFYVGDIVDYYLDLKSMSQFIIERYLPGTTIGFRDNSINPLKTYMSCVGFDDFYDKFIPPVNLPTSLLCFDYLMNRKFDSKCMPMPQVKYPFLVTSLGGSGTHTISNILKTFHLQLNHEEIGEHGSVSWPYAVNERMIANHVDYPHHAFLPKSTLLSPRFEKVLHLTRCPMRQISSLTSHLQISFDFIRSFMLETALGGQALSHTNIGDFYKRRLKTITDSGRGCLRGDKCSLHFVALSWLFWNDYITTYADARFKVENVNDLVSYICENANLVETATLPTTTTNRMHTCLSYLKLPKNEKSQYLNEMMNSSTEFSFNRMESKASINGGEESEVDERNFIQKYLIDLISGRRKKRSDFVSGSIHHKNHASYTIADIFSIDEELAQKIEARAITYGYKSADNC